MSETLFEYIIDYISNDSISEDKEFKRILKWFDNIIYDLDKTKEDWERYRELFFKLKEIREIYQKGKVFVNNYTKNKPKQFSLINREMDYIKFISKQKGRDIAIGEAYRILKTIRKAYSERSYYRLKKRLKEELKFNV